MPRQRARSTAPGVRDRNTRDILGRPGLAGMVRTGGAGSGRARVASAVQEPFPDPELAGAAQLLVMSATGALIASGGDQIRFDTVVAQHGFDGVPRPADGHWVHPIGGVYALELWLGWDAYADGGLIQLELDGAIVRTIVPDRVGGGDQAVGWIKYDAAADSVARIWVVQTSGSAQACDAEVSVSIPDPDRIEAEASSEWSQLFAADAWGITHDGSSWWTTEGQAGVTITERDGAGTALSSFEALDLGSAVRGITFDGSNLWAVGDTDGEVVCYSTAGVVITSFNFYPAWNEQASMGIAFDGTDLWITGSHTDDLRRYGTAGSLLQTISLGFTPYGVTYHEDGNLYVMNAAGGPVLQAVRASDGADMGTIDASGANSWLHDVWIADDGTVYASHDGTGVWQRALAI